MRRQKLKSNNMETDRLLYDEFNADIPMQQQRYINNYTPHTLEAQIQEGDTLQAIALRYDCSVADLKRLNKIEKEIEIHARRTLKVPMSKHNLLLETLPMVHKSGQNSPKRSDNVNSNSISKNNDNTNKNLLTQKLDEKLLVAAVTCAEPSTSSSSITLSPTTEQQDINHIILNTTLTKNKYRDDIEINNNDNDQPVSSTIHEPLINNYSNQINDYDDDDDDNGRRQPHVIPIRKTELTCSGSDCDISWICLLIFILALCFAIPLIYILYITEHPEKFHHNENND